MAAPLKLVGLLGFGGTGKAFVANRLIEVYGFQPLRFADPVRAMLATAFGLDDADLIDDIAKKLPLGRFGGHTLNNMVNTLAQNWGREMIHCDIWTREYERRLGALSGYVVTDDIQKENEVATIRDAGGIIVRVTRPGYRPRHRGVLQRQASLVHDLELVNEGLPGLCEQIDRLYEELNETPALAVG